MSERPAPSDVSAVSFSHRAALRRAEAWVFDLDNTLYPSSTNLFDQIDERMGRYIAEFLQVDRADAHEVQKHYFRTYGTTLRGLMSLHGLAPQPFLDYVHDIDVSVLAGSHQLDAALGRLEGRKLIFTNADTEYTERVIRRLGVEHHFEAVFDIADSDYLPKPDPVVYEMLVNRFAFDPGRSVMVEDMARNLAPAAAMGMTTVWVRTASNWASEGSEGDHVHHVTDDLAAWLEAVTAD